ncbi:MAG: hypothetical protein U1F65_11270, partial [Verrucomicrobiota bacterium]
RAANTPYRPRTRTNVRRNSFGLTGTMSYDEGETAGVHAFFDGTGADYRKVLQTGGNIAIFKVGGITADTVTLVHETNTVVLKIGQQMREDSPGRWSLSAETVNFAKASSSDSRGSRRYGQSNNSAEPASEITDTNSMEMPADQMEDPGGEPPAIESNETAPEAAPAESPALPGGPGNDALRRLMEQRAREEQQSGN